MSRTERFLAIKSALVILGGFILVSLIKGGISRREQDINAIYEPVPVIVPNKTLIRGEIIAPHDLAKKYLPKKFVSNDMLTESDIEGVIGKMLLKDLLRGEFILSSYLSSQKKYEDEKPDRRYFPVTAGLFDSIDFEIGDDSKIDILATYDDSGGKSVTRTILENIRVVRINTSDSGFYQDGKSQNSGYFLVMSPVESSIYAHAAKRGNLSFVLRGPQDYSKGPRTTVNDDNFTKGPGFFLDDNKNKGIEILSSRF